MKQLMIETFKLAMGWAELLLGTSSHLPKEEVVILMGIRDYSKAYVEYIQKKGIVPAAPSSGRPRII